MVVISRCLEERKSGNWLHFLYVLCETVLIVHPVPVPDHVAECQAVDVSAIVRYKIFDVFQEVTELFPVIESVGKVDVSADQHCVVVRILHLLQLEIHSFSSAGALCEILVYLREHDIQWHFIAPWDRNEYITMFLFGTQLVDSVLVCNSGLYTIRNHNTLNAFVPAGNPSVDRTASFRMNTIVLYIESQLGCSKA